MPTKREISQLLNRELRATLINALMMADNKTQLALQVGKRAGLLAFAFNMGIKLNPHFYIPAPLPEDPLKNWKPTKEFQKKLAEKAELVLTHKTETV